MPPGDSDMVTFDVGGRLVELSRSVVQRGSAYFANILEQDPQCHKIVLHHTCYGAAVAALQLSIFHDERLFNTLLSRCRASYDRIQKVLQLPSAKEDAPLVDPLRRACRSHRRTLLSLFETCYRFELFAHAERCADALKHYVDESTVVPIVKACLRCHFSGRSRSVDQLKSECLRTVPHHWKSPHNESRWIEFQRRHPINDFALHSYADRPPLLSPDSVGGRVHDVRSEEQYLQTSATVAWMDALADVSGTGTTPSPATLSSSNVITLQDQTTGIQDAHSMVAALQRQLALCTEEHQAKKEAVQRKYTEEAVTYMQDAQSQLEAIERDVDSGESDIKLEKAKLLGLFSATVKRAQYAQDSSCYIMAVEDTVSDVGALAACLECVGTQNKDFSAVRDVLISQITATRGRKAFLNSESCVASAQLIQLKKELDYLNERIRLLERMANA